jgi:hypothetical protein
MNGHFTREGFAGVAALSPPCSPASLRRHSRLQLALGEVRDPQGDGERLDEAVPLG